MPGDDESDLTQYSFLHTVVVDGGDPNDDPPVMTMKMTIFESVEDLRANRSKEIKLWAYQEDAAKIARLILRTTGPDLKIAGADPSRN